LGHGVEVICLETKISSMMFAINGTTFTSINYLKQEALLPQKAQHVRHA